MPRSIPVLVEFALCKYTKALVESLAKDKTARVIKPLATVNKPMIEYSPSVSR